MFLLCEQFTNKIGELLKLVSLFSGQTKRVQPKLSHVK